MYQQAAAASARRGHQVFMKEAGAEGSQQSPAASLQRWWADASLLAKRSGGKVALGTFV